MSSKDFFDALTGSVSEADAILKQLAADAVPIMAVLAFQGGSLFAKTWLDRAKELGIETNVPTPDLPDDGA